MTTDYGQDPDDDSFTITMNCAPIVNLPMEHAFVTTIPKTYSHETASNLFVFAELIGKEQCRAETYEPSSRDCGQQEYARGT